eukprot:gene36060-46869_t
MFKTLRSDCEALCGDDKEKLRKEIVKRSMKLLRRTEELNRFKTECIALREKLLLIQEGSGIYELNFIKGELGHCKQSVEVQRDESKIQRVDREYKNENIFKAGKVHKQELTDQIDILETENYCLKQDNSLLRHQIFNLKSESTGLNTELDRTTAALQIKTSLCSDLLDENKNLLERLRNSDSKDSENQRQHTLQGLTAVIESKNSELEVLAINFRESERKCNYLLDNKSNIEATLERELDVARLQLKEKSEEATVLESELRTLRFTLSSLQGEYSAAQRKVGQFQVIQSEAVQVERQLSKQQLWQSMETKRESEASVKSEEIENLRSEMDIICSEISSTGAKSNLQYITVDLSESFPTSEFQPSMLKSEEMESLPSESDIVRIEILPLKGELEQVKEELQTMVKEMMKLSEVERSLLNDNSHLREIIDAKDRLVKSSDTEVELFRKEKEELEFKVKDLEVLSRELSSAKDIDSKEMDESKQTMLSMNDELLTLRSTIASLQ